MHDKPQTEIPMSGDISLDDMIAQLGAVDPAEAPDIADSIVARLEAGLGSAEPTEPGTAA